MVVHSAASAIRVSGGVLNLGAMVLANNTADTGACLHASDGAVVTLRMVRVEGSTATGGGGGGGGGVAIRGATLLFNTGVTITGCHADGGSGGGVLCEDCVIAPVAGSDARLLLRGNSAQRGGNLALVGVTAVGYIDATMGAAVVGAGVAVAIDGVANLSAVAVFANTASGAWSLGAPSNDSAWHAEPATGGGVYIAGGATVVIMDGESSVAGNTAETGAGVFVASGATITGALNVTGNSACTRGGGVHVDSGGTLDGLTVHGNCAGCCGPLHPPFGTVVAGGGGVSTAGAGTCTLHGVMVVGNTLPNSVSNLAGGGMLAVGVGAVVSLDACSVTGNVAFGNGGGVAAMDGASIAAAGGSTNRPWSTVVAHNTAHGCGGGVVVSAAASVTGLLVRDNR